MAPLGFRTTGTKQIGAPSTMTSERDLAEAARAWPPPQGNRIWKRACLKSIGWILRDGVNSVETGAMDEIAEVFGDLDDPRTGREAAFAA